jgi:hypothetical protein
LGEAEFGEPFYTAALDQRAHPSQTSHRLKVGLRRNTSERRKKGKGIMRDSEHYRSRAAECLLAAQTDKRIDSKLRLSMAISWLSLARQAEATGNQPASRDAAEPVKINELEV